MSSLKECGRNIGIGTTAVFGAWFFGINNYLGIKDGYDAVRFGGIGFGAAIEAGATLWYLGAKASNRNRQVTQAIVDRNRYLARKTDAILSGNYIELQNGKAIAFPLMPTEADSSESLSMKEPQASQIVFLDSRE